MSKTKLDVTRDINKKIRNIGSYLEDRNIICETVPQPKHLQPILTKDEKDDPQSKINSVEKKLIGEMINKAAERNVKFEIEFEQDTQTCSVRLQTDIQKIKKGAPGNEKGTKDIEVPVFGNQFYVEKNHQIIPILECATLNKDSVNPPPPPPPPKPEA